MLKFLFTVSILLNIFFIKAQNKGCPGTPGLSSDHGGSCSMASNTVIDTAYFNLGDTVFFTYGMSGSSCPGIFNNQIYFNNNAIGTPPPNDSRAYFNTTVPGTYRFEWLQVFNNILTIELISNSPTSINESENKNRINLYPNPSSGKFTIELNNSTNEQIVVEVFDITGNLILQNIHNDNSISLNLFRHPKGIYMVKIQNGQQVFIEKLIYQ